jgi:hypothetical protein
MERPFFSLKLFPLIASGRQKPQKLTAAKIKYESFGPKIFIKHLTTKIIRILVIKKMSLTFLDVEK